ncbi:MAG: hypothetical protein V7L23_02310 [Nostoc sp.]
MNFNPLNLNQWNQWLNRRQFQVLEAAYKAFDIFFSWQLVF